MEFSEMIEILKVIECPTAEKFLECLSPLSDYFSEPYLPYRWIFRGHADHRFELVPTALRTSPLPLLRSGFLGWRRELRETNAQQLEAEFDTLKEFFSVADTNGLLLPEDSQSLRILLFDFDNDLSSHWGGETTHWPPYQIFSLMGLAQHYGVATRLLDWTRNALVAAYFAADEAAQWQLGEKQPPLGADRLGVWAMSKVLFDIHTGIVSIERRDLPIRLVTAPSAGNPNLYAQEGLFTLRTQKEFKLADSVDRRPLDQIVNEEFDFREHVPPQINGPFFYHFTLPLSESRTLLRLLAKHGVSGARLFPGFRGAAQALVEQSRWDGLP